MKTPYETVAHVGWRLLQSKQHLLAATARSFWNHASRTSVGTYTGLVDVVPLMVLAFADEQWQGDEVVIFRLALLFSGCVTCCVQSILDADLSKMHHFNDFFSTEAT